MNSNNYNYESPIIRIQNQLLKEMIKKEEDQFMCEVRQTIGYNIDKSELIKALNYDRDQYEKGYQDGKTDAQKVGHWIERVDEWGDTYYECSSCKEEFTLIEGTPADNLYNYCPECGAYMKGEK